MTIGLRVIGGMARYDSLFKGSVSTLTRACLSTGPVRGSSGFVYGFFVVVQARADLFTSQDGQHRDGQCYTGTGSESMEKSSTSQVKALATNLNP